MRPDPATPSIKRRRDSPPEKLDAMRRNSPNEPNVWTRYSDLKCWVYEICADWLRKPSRPKEANFPAAPVTVGASGKRGEERGRSSPSVLAEPPRFGWLHAGLPASGSSAKGIKTAERTRFLDLAIVCKRWMLNALRPMASFLKGRGRTQFSSRREAGRDRGRRAGGRPDVQGKAAAAES